MTQFVAFLRAINYREGIGVEKDPVRASEVFEAACDKEPDPDDVYPESNRWHACALLGSMDLSGRGLEIDTRRGEGPRTRETALRESVCRGLPRGMRKTGGPLG